MTDSDRKQLEETKERLIASMTGYMSDQPDYGYTKADVQKCDHILRLFIDGLQKLGLAAAESQNFGVCQKSGPGFEQAQR